MKRVVSLFLCFLVFAFSYSFSANVDTVYTADLEKLESSMLFTKLPDGVVTKEALDFLESAVAFGGMDYDLTIFDSEYKALMYIRRSGNSFYMDWETSFDDYAESINSSMVKSYILLSENSAEAYSYQIDESTDNSVKLLSAPTCTPNFTETLLTLCPKLCKIRS